MTLNHAVNIVMTLAAEGIISEDEAQQDAEVLEPMRLDQKEALEMVEVFLHTRPRDFDTSA